MVRGTVKIDNNKCKGCELCISVCPVKILAIDEVSINLKGYHPVTMIDESKCIGCGNCAIMCPDGALSVYIYEKGESLDE